MLARGWRPSRTLAFVAVAIEAAGPLSREERDELRRLIDLRRRELLRNAKQAGAPSPPRPRAKRRPSTRARAVTRPADTPGLRAWRAKPLTARERDVQRLREQGLGPREIAAALGIG